MRIPTILLVLLANLSLGSIAFGSGSVGTGGKAQDIGCKTIDAHCVCQNPGKDFNIENRKWGKANPVAGGEGDCRSKLDIDEALKKAPVLFCMSGDSVNRDPSKPQTSCQVTWTCRETCTMK